MVLGDSVVAAGVVTFEPDIHRLAENLTSIVDQVEAVFVFDNGSTNFTDIELLAEADDRISLIRSSKNEGIATALNRIADRAITEGYAWLVTLDQDSVSPSGMVSELLAVGVEFDAALVTPYIVDRNKLAVSEYRKVPLPRVDEYAQAARRGAITSGALTNLDVLVHVGGFDDRLFIDYVDYDLNQRIILSGRKILRANHTYLLHEVGKATKTWLRVPRKDMDGTWRLETFYSFGHSALRCYYKARNRVLFTRKYGRLIGLSHEGIWQLPQQVVLTVLFESDRRSKLTAFWRGICDGFRVELDAWSAPTDLRE